MRQLICALSVLLLAACGQDATPPAKPAATPAAGAPAAAPEASAPAEAPKKEVTQAPETHGMPGMSELFKAEEKGEKK